ncbi:hypothetical protein ACGVWS_11820 [Enterobacteriaceae bacterium LUAb1]
MDSFEYHVNVIMPDKFYPDDEKWIRGMLLNLDYSTRTKISVKYAEVYQKARESELISYKCDNKARREANTRLREFVCKYAAYSQGKTSPPELLSESTVQNNHTIPEAA